MEIKRFEIAIEHISITVACWGVDVFTEAGLIWVKIRPDNGKVEKIYIPKELINKIEVGDW